MAKKDDICVHLFKAVGECYRGFGKCNGAYSYRSPCYTTCYERRDKNNELKDSKESEE